MEKWRNKNSGKHPSDPEFDPDYNPEEDLNRFEAEQEMKEDLRRERGR